MLAVAEKIMNGSEYSSDEIRNRRVSRHIIFIFVAFCVFTLATSLITYHIVSNLLKKQLAMNCSSIASTVAALIELESDKYENFLQTLDTESDYYKQIQELMSKILYLNMEQITHVYTEARVDATTMMFILDGEDESSPTYSPPGLTVPLTLANKKAFDEQCALTEDDFTDSDYGTILTAYAPIFHSETGVFLGLVGVDVTTGQYNDIISVVFYQTIAAFLLGLAIFGAAFRLFSVDISSALNTDSLTRLANKAAFKDELKRRLNTHPVNYVIMADIDHFKKLNDTYGHEFGDKVLSLVAEQIALCTHSEDCAARYGGEEFVICRSNVSDDRIINNMERIRSHVEQLWIFHDKTREDVRVTISLGAARIPQGERSVGTAIELADKALYIAKETRNTCVLYADDKAHIQSSSIRSTKHLGEG